MNPPGGREHAKFSRKLHEIERIWTPRGGRASLTPPLDPPMLADLVFLHRFVVKSKTRLLISRLKGLSLG